MVTQQAGSLAGFDHSMFTHDGRAHEVFRAGTGPAVIVIHEMPGLHPGVVEFAQRLIDAGYTVFLPSLFGRPGEPWRALAATLLARRPPRRALLHSSTRTSGHNERLSRTAWVAARRHPTRQWLSGTTSHAASRVASGADHSKPEAACPHAGRRPRLAAPGRMTGVHEHRDGGVRGPARRNRPRSRRAAAAPGSGQRPAARPCECDRPSRTIRRKVLAGDPNGRSARR